MNESSEVNYDPISIEARWQEVWADEGTWNVSNSDGNADSRTYVLEMLPYTSGEPHVGHLKNYAVGDAVAHFLRLRGRTVQMRGMGVGGWLIRRPSDYRPD